MATILIIRHAEKPNGDLGVTAGGEQDTKSLTPRGWQRAGAWAEMFVPSLGQVSALPTPTAIFASAPASHAEIHTGEGGSRSRRPLETVNLLALKLGVEVNQTFKRGQEANLGSAISQMNEVVLVCWQHEDIAAIARAIAPAMRGIPVGWPDDRFNVMFRFDKLDSSSPWSFAQVVPIMLDGDKPDRI
jgi:broad specificity phosphatase PhoE